MSYEIHIRRIIDGVALPITADEWRKAVSSTEGVRRSVHETGVPDFSVVEVFFKEQPGWKIEGIWQSAIYFDEGQASIKGVKTTLDNLLDVNDPVAKAASRLAKALNASIQGDEDEIYDLVDETNGSLIAEKEEGAHLRKIAAGLMSGFGIFGLYCVLSADLTSGHLRSWGVLVIWIFCVVVGLYLFRGSKSPNKK